MRARQYIFLIALIIPIIIGSKIAIGGVDDMYGSHYMEDEMMDESCEKGPGMMMHKMGKPMMKDMPMHRMYPWEYLKERLNLTEEQVGKFRKVYSDYRKEVLRKRADIEITEMEMMELLRTKGSSEKMIEEKANKLGSLKSDLNTFRVKTLLKTKDFLSDEQYEYLTNFILGWMRPHRMKWGMPWAYGWDDEM